jgi:hypothetical protein
MTWGSFWNGFKKVVSAPFKLVANVGKTVYNKVIKPVANFGSNAIKSTGAFIRDVGTTIVHMPEKLIHTVDHAVDVGGNTLQGLFKSPMMLLLGVGAVVLLPSLMKMK